MEFRRVMMPYMYMDILYIYISIYYIDCIYIIDATFDMLQSLTPKVRIDLDDVGAKGTLSAWTHQPVAMCWTDRIAQLYIINMASNYKVGLKPSDTNGKNWTNHNPMVPSPQYQILRFWGGYL